MRFVLIIGMLCGMTTVASAQQPYAGLQARPLKALSAQGALRATHLRYHLLTLEALSSEQAKQYAVLRGYADGVDHGHHNRH